MKKWSILNDVVKYIQYNQYTTGHYELDVQAPEEMYGTKMYRKLHDSKREIKEISFNSNTKSLKQDYLDIFEGLTSNIMYIT